MTMKTTCLLPIGRVLLAIVLSVSMVNQATSIVIGGGGTPGPTTIYTGPPTLPPTTLPTPSTLPSPSTTPTTKTPYVPPPTNTNAVDLEVMRFVAGQVSSVLPSWLPTGDPCLSKSWLGVSCNVQGYVISISLSGVPLGVPIETFSNFSSMVFLSYIDLSNTQITGSLPDEWGSLAALKQIMLQGNPGLSGLWPSSWNIVTMPLLGNYSTAGTSVQDSWGYFCTPLPSQSGYYFTTACTGSGNTHGAKGNVVSGVAAKCTTTPIPAGYYVSSLCQPGTFAHPGSNRIVSACTNPSATQYTTQTCISGDTNDIGVNSVVAQCSAPQVASGFFIQACVSGSYSVLGTDSALVPCTQPVAGESYVTKGCYPGNLAFGVWGTDTVLTPCSMSQVPYGKYVQTVCNPGSATQLGADRVLAACATPANGQYVATTCDPGSNLEAGSNTVVNDCTVPITGYYVASLCVAGSPSAAGSDSTLGACGLVTQGTIVHQPCVPGTYNVMGTPTIVQSSSSVQSSTGKTIAIGAGIAAAVLVVLLAVVLVRRTSAEGRREFVVSIAHAMRRQTELKAPAQHPAETARHDQQDVEHHHEEEQVVETEEVAPVPDFPVREQTAQENRRHRRQLSRLNSEERLSSVV